MGRGRRSRPAHARPSGLLAAFGVAMIAALWTYDGWYGLTGSELWALEAD